MLKIINAESYNWYKVGEVYKIRDINKYSCIDGIQVWRNKVFYNKHGNAPDVVMKSDCEFI